MAGVAGRRKELSATTGAPHPNHVIRLANTPARRLISPTAIWGRAELESPLATEEEMHHGGLILADVRQVSHVPRIEQSPAPPTVLVS